MQKIPLNLKFFRLVVLTLSVFSGYSSTAQPKVISSYKDYRQLTQQDSLLQMVELNQFLPTAQIDLRYATKENFTGKKLYPKGGKTYLRLAVARALQKVRTDLQVNGYELKIWDAYRPYDVTKKMWELIGDERYVANPANGSGHNRGLAIDLTLIKNGEELNMGTGFDNFSDTAHHKFQNLSEEVLKNRQLLRSTMEKHGFRALETEWWHYSWSNDRNYDVLNLSFKKLGKR